MLDSVTIVAPPAADVHTWLGPLGLCYCDVFGGPPWNEAGEASDRFLARLVAKSAMQGFRIALALDEQSHLLGFAYGATTFGGGEPEPSYARVTEVLGAGVTDAALTGAFELIELGVVPYSRNRGIGSRLHDALLAGAAEPRAWLMTRSDAKETCRFYRRRGWLELGSLTSVGRGGSDLLMTRRLPV